VIGTPEEIEAANSDDPIHRAEGAGKTAGEESHSGMLLARLGASFRTDDPGRSLEFYRRAAALEPNSSEYAVGYAQRLYRHAAF